MKRNIRIVIGLGNPEVKFERTYHNVGFLFLDFVAAGVLQAKDNSFSLYGSFFYLRLPQHVLIKPKTYMNASGIAAAQALKKFKMSPDALLVAHDDSDIELGNYKISFNRGSAGHRGVQSIIDTLGTKEFWRLRIGIRRGRREEGEEKRIKAGEMVLKKISKQDREVLGEVFKKAMEEISTSDKFQ